MSFDRLKAVQNVVTHEHCHDGIASALLIHAVLPHATIKFVAHGTTAFNELPVSENMLFCDICPPEHRAQEFIDAGAIVLDHHETTRKVVASFGDNGVFADENEEPGVSGAVLAYHHVFRVLHSRHWNDPSVKRFAYLAGIRDTGQIRSPDWFDACCQAEALTFWGFDNLKKFPLWSDKFGEKMEIGEILYRKNIERTEAFIAKALRFTTAKGTRVLIGEGTRATTDAAVVLGNEVDLVVGFSFKIENGRALVSFSTRSQTGVNCRELCEVFEGGGHTASAGFTYPMTSDTPNPYDLFQRLAECAGI